MANYSGYFASYTIVVTSYYNTNNIFVCLHRCYEPTWLNGTLLATWNINPKDNISNDQCELEDEQEAGKVKAVQLQTAGHRLRNIIITFAILAIIIGVILGVTCFKYRHYRPLRIGEKTPTALVNNEVRYMKADLAEKSLLVS